MARYSTRASQPPGQGKTATVSPASGNRFQGSQSMRLGKIIDMVNLPPNLPDNLDSATLDLPGLGELPILDMRRQRPGKAQAEDDPPCVVVAELEGTVPSILVGVILDSFFPC